MALDPPVVELLRSVGYAVASHVMARASLSRGTGRYEEPLTADVADLLSLFDPYARFLGVRRSRSWVRVGVLDFNKAQESRTGADFVIVVRGSSGRPRAPIRKLVLVQAKREDWGRGAYAASRNQVDKARTMASLVGLRDSYFAYYHSPHVLDDVQAPWPTPPNFLYASPSRHRNQHFFAAGELYRALPEGFLEQSAYRRHLLGAQRAFALPPGYEWGIGLLGADFFIDAAGAVRSEDLPTIEHVLRHGTPFGDFLVNLGECREGTGRTDADLHRLLARLGQGPIGDGDGAFDPMFALVFELASAGPEDDDQVPEPEDEIWPNWDGLRRVLRR